MKKKTKLKLKDLDFFKPFLKGAGARIANWREGQKAQTGKYGE